MSESEHRMIEILRILNEQEKPIGSKIIANELKNKGYNLGERAVRYHMQILDEKGYTQRMGYSGRIITELGKIKLEKGLIYDQVDFIHSKFEEMIYKTDLNSKTKTGNLITNKVETYDEKVIDILKETIKSGLSVSPLIKIEEDNEANKTKYTIKTICSTTIDGVLLSHGIPSQPIYGGLVQIEDYKPTHFTEIISYKKTSLSPINAFISKDMTSVKKVLETGEGIIPANFRVIPSNTKNKTIKVLNKLKKINIDGILDIGEKGRDTLGIPVNENLIGVTIIGGVTPFCVAQELGHQINIKTIDELEKFNNLQQINTPNKILKTPAKKTKQKISFLLTKTWNLLDGVDFDINTESGKIIANISYINKKDLDESIEIMKNVNNTLPNFNNPYYKIVNHPTDSNKVGIATVCSLTIDGVLIKNGIMCNPRYGGLLELSKSKLFVELISYNGSSLDPHKIFINKDMTNLTNKGMKYILASIKEAPYITRSESEEILNRLDDLGLKIYKIGKPRELVYNAKVDNYNFGIVAGSGLNGIAALREQGIDVKVKAVEKLLPFNELEKL